MRNFLFIMLMLVALWATSNIIDLGNLENYSNQNIPAYITKDNTSNNTITDEGATLGRVLFYDKRLSSNNSTACASCHMQEFAFSDTAVLSQGANDLTGRHSMRLINSRFSDEVRFFWDKRAATLEEQSTMPIRDHGEMGFSGNSGDPDFQDLLDKLDKLDYYDQLFFKAFGDTIISEDRMQTALAQFIRSIQSFDSKYDQGRALVGNNGAPFPNFTQNENAGKNLFQRAATFDTNGNRIGDGLGCAGCHRPPEFDIVPNSMSNGVIFTAAGLGVIDSFVTRSPSLRDLFNTQGQLNGPLMHNGAFNSINAVIQHYNNIPDFQNPALSDLVDQRLKPNGNPQNLNITPQETQQLISFLQTLSGSDVYTNPKWSNPFDSLGNLTILNSPLSIAHISQDRIKVYPNPASDYINISPILINSLIEIIDLTGRSVLKTQAHSDIIKLDVRSLESGKYYIKVSDNNGWQTTGFVVR